MGSSLTPLRAPCWPTLERSCTRTHVCPTVSRGMPAHYWPSRTNGGHLGLAKEHTVLQGLGWEARIANENKLNTRLLASDKTAAHAAWLADISRNHACQLRYAPGAPTMWCSCGERAPGTTRSSAQRSSARWLAHWPRMPTATSHVCFGMHFGATLRGASSRRARDVASGPLLCHPK